MGRKVFISYKYGDNQVLPMQEHIYMETTVRDYVDKLQEFFESEDIINKGERDNEDLSEFTNETIQSKLRDKIYDSSITIVFVSKGMKDVGVLEKDQWIPWEVSYSLRESTRNGRTSHSNALIALTLPDKSGSYDYYIVEDSCPYCHCRLLKTDFLFQIMKKNMFNIKQPVFNNCSNHPPDQKVYTGNSSYILTVKWNDFIHNMNEYLETSVEINNNINDYDIWKTIE